MGSPAAHLGRIPISPYDIVRTTLGLIILTAAALKGHQLATEPVAEAGLLTSRWFLMAVVEFELFFGLWLICGLYPRETRQAALLCFSALACVSLYKGLSGEASCGCFGRVPVNPWHTFILDVAAVAALFFCRPARERSMSPLPPAGEAPRGYPGVRARPGTRVGWVLGLFLAVGIPAGGAMGSYQAATLADSGAVFGDNQFVVLEPEKWIGKRFPLLRYIDIGNRLGHGKWIVVLYHHECPRCHEAIAEYEELSQETAWDSGLPRVALVDTGPYPSRGEGFASQGSVCAMGRMDDRRKWFASTPLEIFLNEGVIVSVSRHSSGGS
jgi:hypothetical protein